MPKSDSNRILIALDGSDRAFDTIRYICEIPCLRPMEVVLFTVTSPIPESYWDLERQAQYGRRVKDIRIWEEQQHKAIQEYMEEARRKLVENGFAEESVSVTIEARKTGIARDIIKEAKRGYHSVAVGRKGMRRIKDLVLGSVASKLVETMEFTPMLVVGRRYPKPTKILLALDGSEGALCALDFALNTFEGCEEMALTHVIRSEDTGYIHTHREKILPVLRMAKSQLINHGYRPEQVVTKIITGVESRAAAIVRAADEGGYATIVIGRRGLSKTSDFFMGRVSNKVIQLARTKAVCVIN
jgi:nucleotide-binding universal stress UspA family protein